MRPDETTRLLPVTEPSGPGYGGTRAPRDPNDPVAGAPRGGGGSSPGKRQHGTRHVPRLPRVLAVVVALAAAAATVALWRIFVGTHQGQVVEELAYDGALLGRNWLWTVAEPLLDVVSVSFIVLGTVVSMGVALLRRRWSLAMQVAVVVVGSNVTTQFLKYSVFDRVNLGGESWWQNSLPSGHTTVAASVSVALVLAVPRTARPLVALLGAVYTGATGISTLVGQWHRPSDVVAALAVVLFWGALACALTTSSSLDPAPSSGARGARGASRAARGSGAGWVLAVLSAGAVVGGVAAAWALRHTIDVVESAAVITRREETIAYLGGAGAVVAATAVVFALLLALRQTVARSTARVPV
ncbi:phosphatase PAP2 family protein [Sanguibacter suarezii]|uniref:phosphatase PAP2 family protein n=1 Tax=Sanguibacter suarezii TaxID=60921 RepID=UPI001FE04EAC|nr:phosphatase PAP2 family protein [Sanguibacter suarezii]